MFLKQLVFKALNNEKHTILAYILNTVLLILIFSLMLGRPSILYPSILSLIVLILLIIFKAIRLNQFMRELKAAKTQSDGVYADSPLERDVFEAIDEIHHNYNLELTKLADQLEGRNNLFSQFIHNMKSSVSVIGLACEKTSERSLSDISTENEKLKKNLEQALNLLRLDEFSNDYVSEKVNLSDIVKDVINDKKREFIYSQIYPNLIETDAQVYTDRKWCAFMIGQILSNSIKYSSPGKRIFFDISQNDEKTVRNSI